jgi:hypothetical protein
VLLERVILSNPSPLELLAWEVSGYSAVDGVGDQLLEAAFMELEIPLGRGSL